MAGKKQQMEHYMKIGKNKSGFSLLELVITIGIIAALVGIAAPYYKDYVSEEQNSVMRANLHILKKVLMDYKADNGVYPAAIKDIAPKYVMEIPIDPERDAPASWGYSCSSPYDSYSLDAKYNF